MQEIIKKNNIFDIQQKRICSVAKQARFLCNCVKQGYPAPKPKQPHEPRTKTGSDTKRQEIDSLVIFELANAMEMYVVTKANSSVDETWICHWSWSRFEDSGVRCLWDECGVWENCVTSTAENVIK